MLTPAQAALLKPRLDAFAAASSWTSRIERDPIEFPHRYDTPGDIEVAGLISCALAYGRVDLFKPKIESILSRLGANPAERLGNLSLREIVHVCTGFVYRFNVPSDIAVLLLGMQNMLLKFKSLEGGFLSTAVTGQQLISISYFCRALQDFGASEKINAQLGPNRGLRHLLPQGLNGVSKRLNLYLRWMVRGPDAIDFGIWTRMKKSELLIPLDTHVARIAHHLKLTSRTDASPRTIFEITDSLQMLDAEDPIRYDFALCHYGMSGACPPKRLKSNCIACELKRSCRFGARKLAQVEGVATAVPGASHGIRNPNES
jgi:uncharacterized protein (TIGR02757 family)